MWKKREKKRKEKRKNASGLIYYFLRWGYRNFYLIFSLHYKYIKKMEKGKLINNVSATTAIDLKAELAKQMEEFEKTRSSTGKQVTARKPDKKPTVWTRQNKGVDARNAKDAARHQLEAVEGHTLSRSREQLEKKAKIYEALRSGKYRTDDLDEEKSPLIDFDRKYMQEVSFSRVASFFSSYVSLITFYINRENWSKQKKNQNVKARGND